jgi:uncharacterized membrane protein
MVLRLSELHPALVHFPIALLPLAIGADGAGVLTRNRELLVLGRWGITAAAVSAGFAGVSGFIAQEEVNVVPEARKILRAHRALNVGALFAMTGLAVARSRMRRPGRAYLLTGLATVATVGVSAYLGGRMVYDYGVGVRKVTGVSRGDRSLDDVRRAGATAARDLGAGLTHLAR